MIDRTIGVPTRLARWQRVAADPRSAACALGFGSVVVLGALDGGYYDHSWRWAGLALGAVAGIQLVLRRTASPTVPGLVAIASLTALAGWMLLSSAWGIEGTEAQREAERTGAYVAALAALLAVARPTTTRALLTGTLGGILALAGFALAMRLVDSQAPDPYQGTLLKGSIGYANALGVLTAIGVVLAAGLALEAHTRRRRGMLMAAGALSATALALTSSRGALLATLVGLAVLFGARLPSRRLIAWLALAGAALLLLALSSLPLGDRPSYWHVAAIDAIEHPVLGSGAGSYDDVWLEERPIPAFARDAHSVYLETVAELGPVGLVLLVSALGMPLLAARRARGDALAIAAGAAYCVFLVHAGLDWDWEMPVTVLAGLACAASLLGRTSGNGALTD